jgi:hypothetical protein
MDAPDVEHRELAVERGLYQARRQLEFHLQS